MVEQRIVIDEADAAHCSALFHDQTFDRRLMSVDLGWNGQLCEGASRESRQPTTLVRFREPNIFGPVNLILLENFRLHAESKTLSASPKNHHRDGLLVSYFLSGLLRGRPLRGIPKWSFLLFIRCRFFSLTCRPLASNFCLIALYVGRSPVR